MLGAIGNFLGIGWNLLFFAVLLPAAGGILLFLFRKQYAVRMALAVLFSAFNLLFALSLFVHGGLSMEFPYFPEGFEITLRAAGPASFFLFLTAVLFFPIAVYSVAALKEEEYRGRYLLFLFISLTMINGAVLSDSLGGMLFFGEGLFCALAVLLLIRHSGDPNTFVKALTTSGLANLLLMLGIMVTEYAAQTGSISKFTRLPLSGLGLLGFVCMVSGALGLMGCMPFHSWIPDAADDAPTVFMAAFPGFFLKILGGSVLTRIFLDLYTVTSFGTGSIVLMILGVLTCVIASADAWMQHDLKRLSAYLLIGQAGYALIGFGSGTPEGIAGGVCSVVSQIILSVGFFMLCGILEKNAGTTGDQKLCGPAGKSLLTVGSFIVLGLAAAGFPFLGGYFSNGMIFTALGVPGAIFIIFMLLSTGLTAASLLKMYGVLFPKGKGTRNKKEEAGFGMQAPLLIPVLFCLIFWFVLPLREHSFGCAFSVPGLICVILSLIPLLIALWLHFAGIGEAKRKPRPVSRIGKIRTAMGNAAEKGRLDPYCWFLAVIGGVSDFCFWVEHGVSWVYDKGIPGLVTGAGFALHRFDDGRISKYLSLAVAGAILIAVIFLLILL